MKNKPYVNIEIANNMGMITFYHPAHNSLPGNLLNELAELIIEAGQNDAVKVIVLKSAGNRVFCAGANFQELLAINTIDEGRQFFSGFAKVINACRKCPKFIIARVQGKAVGGGVGLAAAVDYCMATQYASIKLSELNIGIGPFVVGPAVERKVGLSGMSQLAINADTFQSAQWAKEKGLYTDIFDTTEELDDAIVELSLKLAKYNPKAMQLLKSTFWKGTEHWDELLNERANTSGSLILMDYSKKVLINSK
ncbi:enoyl-CoA hydratase/isomerase family protein [Maribacter sp. 2308TA10-17]|uniref:enoyl-CoA hydratase/isomerase family protein n=1 Tax=Maribacter sp. 2308TA10-17 TaxID=3386276 RepID=UPI0039BD7BF8